MSTMSDNSSAWQANCSSESGSMCRLPARRSESAGVENGTCLCMGEGTSWISSQAFGLFRNDVAFPHIL